MLKPGLFLRQLPVVWLKLREAASAETILVALHSTILPRAAPSVEAPAVRHVHLAALSHFHAGPPGAKVVRDG